MEISITRWITGWKSALLMATDDLAWDHSWSVNPRLHKGTKQRNLYEKYASFDFLIFYTSNCKLTTAKNSLSKIAFKIITNLLNFFRSKFWYFFDIRVQNHMKLFKFWTIDKKTDGRCRETCPLRNKPINISGKSDRICYCLAWNTILAANIRSRTRKSHWNHHINHQTTLQKNSSRRNLFATSKGRT